MPGDAIRAYKKPPDIDCEAELEEFGSRAAYAALRFLSKIVSGRSGGDFLAQRQGVSIYYKSFGRRFIVYAVEHEDNEVSAMILLAARQGRPNILDGYPWDGRDRVALMTNVIDARFADCFQ